MTEVLLPPPPTEVGPYRIESQLGVGGMGAVYRAFDRRLKRPVAIKRVLPHLDEQARGVERLRREARAIAGLNHPAIVQMHDVVELGDDVWIVMELIEGRTLLAILEAGELDLAQALGIVRQVAEGLAVAHDNGVVHRDVKAENVMVTPRGQAKILDFGLAKLLRPDPEDSTLSVTGALLGTARSMSPEQANGFAVDHRSDLFSLGVLTYETLTGRHPFTSSSFVRTLQRICTHAPEPARELNPLIPPRLSDLIDRLLAKDPARRPQSAREVLAAVSEILAELSQEDSSASLPRPFPPGELPASSTSGAQPRAGRSGASAATLRRRWWLYAAAGVAALAGLTVLLLWLGGAL